MRTIYEITDELFALLDNIAIYSLLTDEEMDLIRTLEFEYGAQKEELV